MEAKPEAQESASNSAGNEVPQLKARLAELEAQLAERTEQSIEVSTSFKTEAEQHPDLDVANGGSVALSEYERVKERYHFLERVSTMLASSIDYDTTLRNVVKLAVPYMADWFSLDLNEEANGRIRRIATAHINPQKEVLAHHLIELYPYTPEQLEHLRVLLEAGQILYSPTVTDLELAGIARSEAHLQALKEINLRSSMLVPLFVRGQLIGAFTLAITESNRQYNQDDLFLAEELARRAATAIDNARLYQQAQTAISARDEFLSVAAHELKTPITSLQGYTQLVLRQLERGGELKPERLTLSMQAINQQAYKLTQLVTRLLDVSRIEGGKLVLERELTDVNSLVCGVVDTIKANLPASSKHQITLQVPATPLQAWVDQLRIEQVLTNLLDNAIKYSPKGGLVSVEVAMQPTNPARLYITVSDQGIGIAPSHREGIFNLFYQVGAVSKSGGMGIGLYVSRQIVELHKGQISVEDGDESGSRFVVNLPTGV